MDVNSVTPGSQTVGETRASLYATEPLMQCSEAAQLFTHTHTHTACVRAERAERPTPGRRHPKYSLRYNGSKHISDGHGCILGYSRTVCLK